MKNRKNRPVNGKVFRSGVYSTAILAAAILLAVLVNLVVRALPSKYTEFDLSEAKMYTLGDSSVQLAQRRRKQPYPLGAEGPDPLPHLCGAVRGRKCIHRKPDRNQRGGQRGAGCRRSVRV